MLNILIKAQFAGLISSVFRSGGKKNRKPSVIKSLLIALLVIYVVGALSLTVGLMFQGMLKGGIAGELSWLYFAFAGIMAIGICFMLTMFAAQSALFASKDNELLLSMPIKPRTILTARMLSLLLLDYLYAAMIFIPALVVYAANIGPGAGFYLRFALGFLLCPLFGLALACCAGYLLARLMKNAKSKLALQYFFLLSFFVVYFWALSRAQNAVVAMISSGGSFAPAFRRFMPFMYSFGRMVAGGSITDFVSCLAWFLIPISVVWAVTARNYFTLMTARYSSRARVWTGGGTKASGQFTALVSRELKVLLSSPIYVFNSTFGALFAVFVAGWVAIKGPGFISMFVQQLPPGFDLPSFVVPSFAAIICGMAVMVNPASASISLEGNRLWIIKSMPVKTISVLYSKLFVNIAIGLPPIALAVLSGWIFLDLSLFHGTMILLLGFFALLFSALFGLFCNLMFPFFDWVSEAQVVKRSASVMISVFGGMAFIALPVMTYIIMGSTNLTLFMAGALVYELLPCACLAAYIHTKGIARFESF